MQTEIRCTGAHAPNTPHCPAWCTRTHRPGAPIGYHESATLATWEKTAGEVRTITAVQFVGAAADRTRAARMVAVKGGATPIMLTLDEAERMAGIFGGASADRPEALAASPVPSIARAHLHAAELLAA